MKKNKKKKILVILFIIVLLLIIGGYFLFFNKKSKDYTSELPNPEENPTIKTIREEMTLDNSMEGFANFASQLYGIIYSIDSTVAEPPEEFDNALASQIVTLDAYMSLYNNYNSYIDSLDNNTYSALKDNWKKFAKQSKDLFNEIKNNNYTKGKKIIENDSFEKSFTALSDEFSKFTNSSDENTSDENTNAEASSSETNSTTSTDNTSEGNSTQE